MITNLILIILVLISFIIQSTIGYSLEFGSISPNLLMIVTVSLALMRGKKVGLLVGFTSGLLIDIFYGDVIGFYALLYMCIGFINGFFRKIFYPENIKLPLLLIMLSDLSYGLIIYFLLFLMRWKTDFLFYFSKIILPEVIYTLILSLMIYPLLLLMNQKFEKKGKRGDIDFV